MDEIEKFLRQRNQKDRSRLIKAVNRILRGETAEMDIKKLKGHRGLYRLRASRYRIIFEKEGEEIWILRIDERDDRTYKF